MKKVLQVVSVPHRGGAETMIMNVLRQTDHDEIQYDFISHTPNKSDYDEEINSYGGKVIHIPSLGTIGIIRYIKKIWVIKTQIQLSILKMLFQSNSNSLSWVNVTI